MSNVISNCWNEQKDKEANEALAMWVCYEKVPARAICSEDGAFRRFFLTLNPHFRPSFESLERNCLKIYAGEREQVKEVFSKIGGHVGLSVDELVHEERWVSYDHYICLRAHFIDDDWKLKKWVIKYCGVYGENQDLPTVAILKSLKEWDIEGKVFTITAARTSDIVDEVKKEIQEIQKLPMNGQLFHVQCSSNIIGRMVEKGFKTISTIIDKVQQLSWSHSEPWWYLTSLKLREAMGEFSSARVKKGYAVPSKGEWGKVRSVCRIVDKIYAIVEGLFKVKNPAANLFLPHLLEIRAFLIQESSSSDEFVKVVALKMLKCFDKYWKDMYLVLAIAAFMDPRFKMKYIEFSFSKLEAGDGPSKAASILETIRRLYDIYALQTDRKEYLMSDSSSDSDEDEEYDLEGHSEKQCINLVDRLNMLKEFGCSVQSINAQPHKSDLDLYLEEPVFPWNEKFSVLDWWKDNCSKYPHLSRMARDFLAIPMSVATSHDAYYTELRKADKTLLPLKAELMNALKCTRSWKLGYNKCNHGTEN